MTAENIRAFPEIPKEIKKIHIVGVVGTAMGSLAAMLKEKGYEVRGSDAGAYPPMSDWLDEKGIPYSIGYDAKNLDWNPDLVIIGNVVRNSYADAVETLRRGLPYISLPEALRHFFLQHSRNAVITGTHGKTTTSSMLAWILYSASIDPSFFIGGVTGNFHSNFRLGGGDYFVIEGDEYDTAFFDKVPKFWHYQPYFATINNIEYDHADIYDSIDDVKFVFRRFAELLPPEGALWINGDDANCREVAANAVSRVRTFGLSSSLDLYATDISYGPDKTSFNLHYGDFIGEVEIPLPGAFNVRNFLGAFAMATEIGIKFNEIASAIAGFKSTVKRQQLIAEINGIRIYDDFAHHPTAVSAAIEAFKQRFPGHRLLVAFEAKSNTSIRSVFQHEYADALSKADVVILAKSWKKASLPPEKLLNFDELVEEIRARGTVAEMIPEVPDIAERLAEEAHPGDIILGLSGSSFGGLHQQVADRLRDRYGV